MSPQGKQGETPPEVLGLRPHEILLSDLRDFRVGDGSEATFFLGDEAVIAMRISTGKSLTLLQLNVNYRFPGLAARIAAALAEESMPELFELGGEAGGA
jgi:hypothetical protein